jgi:hypothetical protein
MTNKSRERNLTVFFQDENQSPIMRKLLVPAPGMVE